MRKIALALPLLALGACAGIVTPPPKPIDQMTKVEICEYSVALEADTARLSGLIATLAAVWGVDTTTALALAEVQIARALESRNIVCIVE
jgi:hypothetical protein